jgi:Type IV secretion system pilin
MRRILINLVMSLSLALPLLLSSGSALALTPSTACPGTTTSQGQVLEGVGETGNNCDSSGVSSLLSTVISILSYVVGALAIVMIILAGSKYITSGGDANKVGNAKNTLIYALIGLAVAVCAQALVHYVLSNASTIS